MAAEENKAVVRRELEEIFNHTGNLDAADEVYTPDYIGHQPAPDDIQGVEGAKQFAAIFRRAFPDLRTTVEDQIAEGDKVVTRWMARGTHEGEFVGIAPTGNQVEITGITISRIANGKVAEDWTEYDALGMMEQLGVVPPPD